MTKLELKDFILSQMESDEPDLILEIVKQFEGKIWSKRIVDKLPGGSERWYLRKEYGMLQLQEFQYRSPAKERGFYFTYLIEHSETNVYVDSEDFVKKNPAQFEGRIERNIVRRGLLDGSSASEQLLEVLSFRTMNVETSIASLQEASVELQNTLNVFNMTDTYALDKIVYAANTALQFRMNFK